MDSVAVTVPLRPPTKKMKKRKELDALAPRHAVSRRSSGKRSSQELLSDSSDDRSEYWNISTRGRKCRGRNAKSCPDLLRACNAFLACMIVLVTATLIWLFIDVRQQLTVLRTELDQVIAGNEGVPDALQKCHSLSKDLRNNQTRIDSQITDLKLQMNNYTAQISVIQHSLRQVQKWMQTDPELANLPKNLKELSESVASFGSQIGDLTVTVNTLKETNRKLRDAQNIMQQNIVNITTSLSEISNNGQKSQAPTTNETKVKTDELSIVVSQLTSNLSRINETLWNSLKWTMDDQAKDHKKLDNLTEKTQGMSMQIISLVEECANKKDEEIIRQSVHELANQMKDVKASNTDFNTRLKQLDKMYHNLENSTNAILSTVEQIRSQYQSSKQEDNMEKSSIASMIRDNIEETTDKVLAIEVTSQGKVPSTRSKGSV